MTEQTGVETSLSEEDAKEYTHEVLAELKRHWLKILLLTSESIQTEDGECEGYVQKFSSSSLVSWNKLLVPIYT
jgi:hypothetical protein